MSLQDLKGIPGSGERVDADPANWIRDLFHANDCRIEANDLAQALGRMSFTYGAAVGEAWRRLVLDHHVKAEGEIWVWGIW